MGDADDRLAVIFSDPEFAELEKLGKKKSVVKKDPEVTKFQEIIDFVNEKGREPEKTEEWSLERALWARLNGFRGKPERAERVKDYDTLGLLDKDTSVDDEFSADDDKTITLEDIMNDDELLDDSSGLFDLSRYRKTVNVADKISQRKHARNFNRYKPLFEAVNEDLATGRRKIIPFDQNDVEPGRFYVQSGVMLYVVSIGDFYTGPDGRRNAKMHVVYENGVENKALLYRSLISSLYSKERNGRMVTEPTDEEALSASIEGYVTTGHIYVLESLSHDPQIRLLENLYKIGFTRGTVEGRIANAEKEMTYLKAPVKVVRSYEVQNVNAQIVERTLHDVFHDKQCVFQDSKYEKAIEWYIVPLDEIDRKINKIFADLQK